MNQRSKKPTVMKVRFVPAIMLVFLMFSATPARAADSKSTGAKKVRRPPGVTSVTSPSPSPPLEDETQGKLSRLGGKVSLRLTRSVTRVDIFAGSRKLATLGGGIIFDVTPYLSKASATGLNFHYYGANGRKSIQHFRPGEVKALSMGITATRALTPPGTVRTPKDQVGSGRSKSGSGKPASGRTLALSKQPTGAAKGVIASQPAASGVPAKLATPGALTITRPGQGDFMVEGHPFVLQWSGLGNIQEKCVHLDLFQGLSHVASIARNVCVNGYNWHLPQGLYGINYKIRLRTIDNALMDDSEPFSIISAQPDLSVTNLHIQPAAPDMADNITVSGVIRNSGHGTSASTNATIRLQAGNWSTEKTLNIPSLAFGPNAHLPFSKTFDPVAAAQLTATVQVDVQNQVAEADENNNTGQLVFPVVKLPNLKVCVNEEIYNTLGRTSIPILVKNYSSEPAGPSVCRVWVHNHGSVNHNVPALGPFESYRFSRSERFTVAGWRSYSATVDYGDTIRESYENDNVADGRIHAAGIAGSHPIPQPQCN